MVDYKKAYGYIITSLLNIREEFDDAMIPEDAKAVLDELIEMCKSDYRIRFVSDEDGD